MTTRRASAIRQFVSLHLLVDRAAYGHSVCAGAGRQSRDFYGVLKYFLRTAYFFPLLMSWASVSLIWLYVLDPNFGFFNYYLRQLGLNPPNWLVDRQWAMAAVLVVDLWRTVGFTFIILLAGLQGVPRSAL